MDISKTTLPNYKSNKSRAPFTCTSSEAARISDVSTKQVSWDVSQLKEGQIIKGEIIDLRRESVTIRLEPSNLEVIARLEGDFPLAIGQTTEFQVTLNTADQLTLKYVSSNMQTTTEALIAKALTASNLPLSNRNKSLVALLLNHKMPIDKQSLQTMVKLSHQYRDANPLTLVLMQKHHIPITKENIIQFEAYASGTNQLLSQINELSKNIIDLLQMPTYYTPVHDDNPLHKSGETANKLSLPEDIANQQNTYDNNINNQKTPSTDTIAANPFDDINQQEMPAGIEHSPSSQDLDLLSGHISTDINEMSESLILINKTILDLLCEDISETAFNETPNSINAVPLSTLDVSIPPRISDDFIVSNQNGREIQTILNEEERSNLLEYIKPFPEANQLNTTLANGRAPIGNILHLINRNISSQGIYPVLKLLQSSEYAKLLKEAFHEKWTLSPEKPIDSDIVSKLYETLEEDINRLNNLIKASKDTPELTRMEEPIKDLQGNLSFLKDLNQIFTYLPLPLQLKEQTTHCDLYVLARKKARKDPKDGLNILLHLDMANLGPLNIYIKMKNQTIHAKFYLADSAAGQLLTKHMNSLTNAMQKKGYSLFTEVVNTYKKPDFISDFMEHDALDMEIQRYTFDVRT
ncbi:MAG: flagellar hook-length control protein FliK [Clostridiales bacterium]|nr:flagellar hook-length control protein FliK [Clostridiales bacterium]